MASRRPPRPNIVVVCPMCGHRQDEPSLVVSTICRRCRSHIEVRDGVVVGPFRRSEGPALGPPSDQRPPEPAPEPAAAPLAIRVRSGNSPEEPPPPRPRLGPPPGLKIRTAASPLPDPPAPPPPPTLPPGLRIRRQLTEDAPELPAPEPLPMPPGLRIRARPPGDEEEPPAPEPAAAGNAKPHPRRVVELLEKLLRPDPPKRGVLCLECGRRFLAPAAAEHTNCPSCGCYMSLRDYTVEEPWAERIETRGNVVISRKGKLGGPPVLCHDLTIRGTLETSASVSGQLAILTSARFRAKLRCEKLLVQKRARVEFIHPVETGEAVIDGTVTGSIRARGTVTLLKRSRLRGNITATRLILKPGASHTGILRVIPPATPEPPAFPAGSPAEP